MDLGESGPLCQEGVLHLGSFPISFHSHNTTSVRNAFQAYDELTRIHEDFASALVLFEGYPLQAVRKVSDASTAVADRGFNVLV
jgi:hypothetical protein